MDSLRIENKDNALHLVFSGEITLEITTDLKKAIEKAMADETFDALVADLAQVTFMDSSGIGFLVALNTKIMGTGKKMYLLSPSTQVRKTFELVQLSNFFTILDSEEDLLQL
ncbi:MAG: anti-sigma factor antagonist [Desulfovibrio sp.]|nr:MAG: anti-sigma factor antagonist [Desulfovibrio sp.]